MIWAGCGGYVGHCDIVAHCDIAVYSLIITGSSEICHGDALGVGCVIFSGILHRALGIGTCRALNGRGDVIVGSGVSSSAKLVKSMVPRSLKSSDRSWIWIGFTMRSSRNWSTWVTSGSVAGGGGVGWGWVGGGLGGGGGGSDIVSFVVGRAMGVLVSLGLVEMSGIGDMTAAVAAVMPSSPLTSGFRGVVGGCWDISHSIWLHVSVSKSVLCMEMTGLSNELMELNHEKSKSGLLWSGDCTSESGEPGDRSRLGQGLTLFGVDSLLLKA